MGGWGVVGGTLLRVGDGASDRGGSGGRGEGRRVAGRHRGPPAGKAQPLGPAPPPHLHVGHEAFLDSPTVFIDLFQELQLIIVVATHGGDHSTNSWFGFEERCRAVPLPEAPASGTHRAGAAAPGQDGLRQVPRLQLLPTTAFRSDKLDCPLVFTFWDSSLVVLG